MKNPFIDDRDNEGKTRLIRLAELDQTDTVELLLDIKSALDLGADTEVKDKTGYTALMHAVEANNKDIVQLL